MSPPTGVESVTRLLRSRQLALVGLLLVACVVLSVTTSTFLTSANLRTVALGGAIDLVLVAGQTMIIIGGGFDLSIGSTLGLAAVVIGILMGGGLPWWAATLIAIVCATGCGLFNGLLVALVGVNPLIATLGTLFVFYGIALVATQSATVFATGPLVSSLGQGTYLGVPAPVWIALAIVLATAAFMRWHRFGREVYFVGGNASAARLVGVSVRRVRIWTYVFMGFLAGIAGALAIGRVGTANADTGSNEELNVIAAAVLGGASLSGGEGSIIGSGLGVVLIQIVDDAVVLLNVSVFWQQLIVGVVLIVAVALNVLSVAVRERLSVRSALSQVTGLVGTLTASPPGSAELSAQKTIGTGTSGGTGDSGNTRDVRGDPLPGPRGPGPGPHR